MSGPLAPSDAATVTLTIGGMTCAACAARIEKTLNRLDGVEATVNYATERARVAFDPAITSAQTVIGTVESIGYRATPTAGSTPAESRPADESATDMSAEAPLPVETISLGMPTMIRRKGVTTALKVAPVDASAAAAPGAPGDDTSGVTVSPFDSAPIASAHDTLAATGGCCTSPAVVEATPVSTTVAEAVAGPTEALAITPTPAPALAITPTPAPAVVAAPEDEHDRHLADARRRLVVTAALGLPVLVLSMVPAWQFRNWQWLCFALAAPVATWGAWPFHRIAWRNARHATATMDTLVSIGVIAAFGWSTWALFRTPAGDNAMTMPMSLRIGRDGGHHLYLEVASGVVALILAGRFFEARAKRRASGALRALVELGAKQATLVAADGTERVVPAASLRVGDRFVVRPGEQIATDGVVEAGTAAVDQSLVTGESVPVAIGLGDGVIGSTLNTDGHLIVRATAVGSATALARITRLVEEAQYGKAPIQRLADRVSAIFVPVVLTLAAATLGFWYARTGQWSAAIAPAVAVLIVACPCALGLATPTALLVGTGRGARLGVLIRGPEILESTRRVDTILLDKTGTITTGVMAVSRVVPIVPFTADELLRLAAAVESRSEHPIARAITRAATERGLAVVAAVDFRNEPGVAAHGVVGGRDVSVGRGEPGRLTEAKRMLDASGETTVIVMIDGLSAGLIALRDAPKASSARAIAELRRLGIRPLMLTGDNPATAEAVGREVGLEPSEIRAGVRPDDKLAVVRDLQASGGVVAMVGDGVNDAAALAAADLGIAMGSGTDAAIEASDLTLVRSDLAAAVDAIRLSRRTLATIKANLFWAFAYNVAAIPLAMSRLLSPTIAGIAMAASSVFVVSNSLRLRRFRSTPPRVTVGSGASASV